ncbi:MAG: gluconate 2-dehydrogenase subunit 3 family protein [Ginsengibacter sp.]
MERREALQYISLLLGGTVVGGSYFLSGCKSKTGVSMVFTPEDISYLDEIAETILPATGTPGAKAAKVGQFMTVMVNDCYEAADQKIFHEGMRKLDDMCDKKNGKSFMESTPQQRHDLLTDLDKEAKDYKRKTDSYFDALSNEQKHDMTLQKDLSGKDPRADKMREYPNYYFTLMKELTLLGYFTSEVGCTQARRYIETPGRFEGCIPYKKGDKAWAT